MIEVAHAILEERADVMDFSDLVNQIQNYLGKSDSEIRDALAQFYTDLNIDGSFISLGDNRWGLRSWYAIDSIDEEVNHGLEDEEEDKPRRKNVRRLMRSLMMMKMQLTTTMMILKTRIYWLMTTMMKSTMTMMMTMTKSQHTTLIYKKLGLMQAKMMKKLFQAVSKMI